MAQFSPLDGALAGVCLEGVLYGIFFLLFILSMVLLTTRSRKTSPQASKISILFSPLIFASICMFITITAVSTPDLFPIHTADIEDLEHWCIVSYRLFQAVEAREGPMIFYVDWKQATMVAYMSVFTASIIIGDAVIVSLILVSSHIPYPNCSPPPQIYRLWVVGRFILFFVS